MAPDQAAEPDQLPMNGEKESWNLSQKTEGEGICISFVPKF